MDNKYTRWLSRELPGLVKSGVLDDASASRVRDHYKGIGVERTNLALTISGILGTLLIGAGLILFFAYNWAGFGKPMRTLLSFAPLLFSQGLCYWTMSKRRGSAPWRESAGLFATLSIGASIALVSQTYHVGGSFDQFVLVWMALTLPVIYFLNAATPLVIYLCGITIWAGSVQSIGGQAAIFYPLFLLAMPFLVSEIRVHGVTGRGVLPLWLAAIALCISIGITLEKALPGLWIPVYLNLFALFYLCGLDWKEEEPSFWTNPLIIVGGIGIGVLSVMLTFDWPWESIGWRHYRYGYAYHQVSAVLDYLIFGALLTGNVLLLVGRKVIRRPMHLLWSFAGILSVLCYAAASASTNEFLPLIIFNLYVFVLGLVSLISGFRSYRLSRVNTGMALLCVLLLCRFFDAEVGILARAIVFVLLGVCFLSANALIVRRKRGVR